MKNFTFRAWDKKHKRMTPKFDLYDADLWMVKGPLGEQFANQDMVPMQYVGITDKNGAEICEGDILMREHFVSAWVVERRPGAWVRRSMNFATALNPDDNLFVIGNVYEHPDLLK